MPALVRVSPTVCGRCLAQRLLSTSPLLSRSARIHTHGNRLHAPDTIPLAGHAKLTNRSLIALEGRDASRFLQGLTTANLPSESSSQISNSRTPSVSSAIYSAFLNAQGRLLHDVFIFPIDTALYTLIPPSSQTGEQLYLVEVDAAEQDNLLRWLKRYKLRSKVTIRAVSSDECTVWSTWDNAKLPPLHETAPRRENSGPLPQSVARFTDSRAPGLGYRFLQSRHTNGTDPVPEKPDTAFLGLPDDSEHSTLAQYTVRRYLYGVPEGQSELPRENALTQESCLDYMGGVDFRKGCYVGQELVIRTQHTGVVRKRVLPVLIHKRNDPSPVELNYNADKAKEMEALTAAIPLGTDIVQAEGKGRRVAKWMGGVGNLGLALWRLENMEGVFKLKLDNGGLGDMADGNDLSFTPFVPEWWTQRKEETRSV